MKTFAAISLLVLSFWSADTSYAQDDKKGDISSQGCPSPEILKTDRDASHACKLFIDSLVGKFPKKFSYPDAQILVQYAKKLQELLNQFSLGKITAEDLKGRMADLDTVCSDIAGANCGMVFTGGGD